MNVGRVSRSSGSPSTGSTCSRGPGHLHQPRVHDQLGGRLVLEVPGQLVQPSRGPAWRRADRDHPVAASSVRRRRPRRGRRAPARRAACRHRPAPSRWACRRRRPPNRGGCRGGCGRSGRTPIRGSRQPAPDTTHRPCARSRCSRCRSSSRKRMARAPPAASVRTPRAAARRLQAEAEQPEHDGAGDHGPDDPAELLRPLADHAWIPGPARRAAPNSISAPATMPTPGEISPNCGTFVPSPSRSPISDHDQNREHIGRHGRGRVALLPAVRPGRGVFQVDGHRRSVTVELDFAPTPPARPSQLSIRSHDCSLRSLRSTHPLSCTAPERPTPSPVASLCVVRSGSRRGTPRCYTSQRNTREHAEMPPTSVTNARFLLHTVIASPARRAPWRVEHRGAQFPKSPGRRSHRGPSSADVTPDPGAPSFTLSSSRPPVGRETHAS